MKILQILSLFLPLFLFLLSCPLLTESSFSSFHITHHQSQCLDDQKSALIQLQQGLYYAPNFTVSSKAELWGLKLDTSDCCSWKGVSCDAFGHVTGLDLSYNNLSGSFHSIFNLHHLQYLNLAGNNFNTSLFQYGFEFERLPNLTHLNLSNSCFHGQIPVELASLTRLVSLDLSSQDSCYLRYYQILDPFHYFFYNHSLPFEVQQPLTLKNPSLKTLVKKLRSLTELFLDSVNISIHSTQWCETISQALPKLRVLSLSSYGLTGPFCSSLSKLLFLSKLNLSHNPISYLPPNFLDISSHLVSLSLASCSLSGDFPAQIFLLPTMQSIDISRNYHLGGPLPEFVINNSWQALSLSFTNFSGKLPESIGNLKRLTYLDISYCHFSGPIPSPLTNLTDLVHLDLRGNMFSGPVPPFHTFRVPNLTVLRLGENSLSGSIHSSIFTLPSLQRLDLRRNQLDGDIDESIFHLSMLERLSIGDNSFGPMKLDMFFQMGNLRGLDLSNISLSIGSHNNKSLISSQLQVLDLRSCNFTKFPELIKTQDKLVILDLSNNQIHGLVPNWLWKTTLVYLNLSFNAVDFPEQIPFPVLRNLYLRSCNLSTFPPFLKNQDKLEYLDLSENQISGAIPNWVWKKSLQGLHLSNNHLSYLDQSDLSSFEAPSTRPICNLSQLKAFTAAFNNLSGPIPNCLGNITTLFLLDLEGNNFTGNIPNFAEGAQLEILRVSENRLEGKLPRSLAKCPQLRVLDVGSNMMHDTFPIWLGELPRLEVLVLRENRFYGEIKHLPKHEHVFSALDVLDIASNNSSGEALSLDFLQATQVRSLKMGGNKFEGKLPRSLANSTRLEVLDLGNNMFHDTFPYWLEKLPCLKVLVLRANRFHGTIQISGSSEAAFPMLRILDIASNNFSGELPFQFFHCLRAMMQVIDGNKVKPDYIGEEEYYQDSVTIVNKGFEILYTKILTILACLDPSDNNFHGLIPQEVKYLILLKVLNLSHNSFFGPIPLGLENLTELESLDLSQNNLLGKIPPQLVSLTFLEKLNMSYNHLDGSIPRGNQFNTFENDSYNGNPRLCGPPLTRKCNQVVGVPTMPFPKEDVDSWANGISVI